MISKVSTQSNMAWIESEAGSKHKGIARSAMDSFTESLVKQAKDMKSRGASYEDIAKKCNLSVETLKSLISGDFNEKTKKLASCDSDCEARSVEAKEKGDYLSEADKAYESVRGPRSAAALPKDFVPSQNRILSARGRTDKSDIGGSRKQMRMSSSPSIFDVDVLDRAIAQKDNGEKIRETNKRIEDQRDKNKYASRYETIDGQDLAEALRDTDLRKDAGVHSLSGREAVNYSQKLPVTGMSIFETPDFGGKGDFSHIAETEGEQLGKRRKAEAAAKKSDNKQWVEDAQKRASANSANSSFGKMINSLLEGKKA